MEQVLTDSERKIKRENLLGRIIDSALEGTEQKICPHFETCDYVVKDLSIQLGFSIIDRANYYDSICKNYHCVCELNLGNKK
jgi:hypothetical protein